MLSQLFHIDENLIAWLKCVGIGAGIGATIGAGIAFIGFIFVVWGIGSLLLNTLGISASVLVFIGLLIGLLTCCIPDGKEICLIPFAFLASALFYCLLWGGLAGGLIGGFGTAAALDIFAEKWKKRYRELICNWIHNNFEDGSRTKEFLLGKVSLVSEFTAYILRKKKRGFIKANIIAIMNDDSTTVVANVDFPFEEVPDSGLMRQDVLLGSKEEFLEMESGL